MFNPNIVLFGVVSTLGTALAQAAWHLDSLFPLVTERLDPVISPNALGSHLHDVTGGANFGAAYSYENSVSDLSFNPTLDFLPCPHGRDAEILSFPNQALTDFIQIAANCTSSAINIDKSNYWMPPLFGINDGGASISDVVPIHPFPEGLRMTMGSPDAKVANAAIVVTCHVNSDLSTGDIVADNFNFDRDCPYGIRIELDFMSCWDGINLYLDDMSHMAYPVVNALDFKSGQCPFTHPIKLPQIMLEYTFHTSSWAPGKTVGGNLAWANGDTTGYGAHADFVNG